jgi:hypothetical protein
VDQRALRRNGEKVYVRYLLEHPIAYENKLTKRHYRGTVVNVTIDCKARTVALGDFASYAQPGAGGQVVDRFTASGAEAQPRRIVAGGTDDILWRHACRREQ